MSESKVWNCSIHLQLEDGEEMPSGCDFPLRDAAHDAALNLGVGLVLKVSSGWGDEGSKDAEIAKLREEAEISAATIKMQSIILTESVNAIRGEPPELTLWSHHDLAELAKGLIAEIADKDAEIAKLKSNEKKAFWCGFERAIMTPDDLHILNHWNGYLEIQSVINPIGDKP